ncbi:gp74 [Caballeronia temeraria]|uniref:Gp74 n=1 Tax=Caballeronia temeraria TaxID=1777137 RepID=A0A158D137_9BURK|nr:gp74 [Caballeronia temeraria]
MKRSKPLLSKTPMKRSAWPLADRATALRRSKLKARVKKPTAAEGSKYLAACRGEPCYLNVKCPWTDWADPTVVDCHSNQSKHGKGGALKAKHWFTVPGCAACHEWLDRSGAPWEQKCAAFDGALARWEPVRARKMGLKEEEGAVLDSNTNGHAMAHAARPQREALCRGAVSTHGGAGDEGVQAGAPDGAEHDPAVCLG